MNLELYILEAFPNGLSYNEAAQLCLRLYCTTDALPEYLHTECSKEELAKVFSRLTASGFLTDEPLLSTLYGANHHNIDDKGHWIEVIASIFKKGNTRDMELGELLVNRLTDRCTWPKTT